MNSSLSSFLSFIQKRTVTRAARLIADELPTWVTPTGMTLFRLFLTILLFVCLLTRQIPAAFTLYVLAFVTDALDGELARRRKQETSWGSQLDPTVDKALHAVVFLYFFSVLPFLISLLIILEAFLFLHGLYTVIGRKKIGDTSSIEPNTFGKWKMFFAGITIILFFLLEFFPDGGTLRLFATGTLFLAVLCSATSFFLYIRGTIFYTRVHRI